MNFKSLTKNISNLFNNNDNSEKNVEPQNNTNTSTVTISKIVSPLNGELVALSEVPDQVFSTGLLGSGVAIIPSEGKLVAPCDGIITVAFPTGHAIGLVTNNSIELLMHIGLDTVELNGKYFDVKVKVGDSVAKGDVLVQFDIEKIKDSGYNTITPIIVTNTSDYQDIKVTSPKIIESGTEIIEIN